MKRNVDLTENSDFSRGNSRIGFLLDPTSPSRIIEDRSDIPTKSVSLENSEGDNWYSNCFRCGLDFSKAPWMRGIDEDVCTECEKEMYFYRGYTKDIQSGLPISETISNKYQFAMKTEIIE